MNISNEDIKNCVYSLRKNIEDLLDKEAKLTPKMGELYNEIKEMRMSAEETLVKLEEEYKERFHNK